MVIKSLRAASEGGMAIKEPALECLNPGWRTARRAFTVALVTVGLTGCAAQAHSHRPPIEQPSLVQVEVYDRTERSTLPVYPKDGRRYILGTPGHEYAVRIRNRTPSRVLVVTSVDGLNVISGDTASPSQSGYVLDPYGSVEIIGWRKSLQRTAAFFFTEHQNSYAARTGRPDNVGVIGVAVFREKVHFPAPLPFGAREEGSAAPAASARGGEADDVARADAAQPRSKLGTGHGRSETSRVRLVDFERASESPAETIAIQYDRRENLIAMGVLPARPHLSRRDPDPFPGHLRFAPDPR